MAKTSLPWSIKMNNPAAPEIKTLEKSFADLKSGSRMLIPTPMLIADYLRQTTAGSRADMKQMRKDLAAQHHADGTCPLTTGIFLRTVAEYTHEQKNAGIPVAQLIPVWRILHAGIPLWQKLSFDPAWLMDEAEKEGI